MPGEEQSSSSVAYRAVPVHPADRLLLGLSWHGDTLALPFGLRSASSRRWPMLCCGPWGGMASFMPCTISTIFCYSARPTRRNATRLFRAAFSYAIGWVFLSLLIGSRAQPHARLSFLGILIDTERDTLASLGQASSIEIGHNGVTGSYSG